VHETAGEKSEVEAINNRWIQLIGSLVAMIMIANLQYSWTLFVKPMQAATGWALPQIQWAFTLFILFQTWVQPLEGWLIDKIGPSPFIATAGVLCGAGWSLMGSARSPAELYVCYCLAGVGAAFVYSGSMGSGLKWFPDRRGLAAGIMAAGYGAGTALMIPLVAALIKHHGYRTAFLGTGILQGVIILAVAPFLRHPGSSSAKPTAQRSPNPRVRRNTEQFTTLEMLRTPQFYLLYVMLVAMATGGLLVTAQAGPIAASWGLSVAALTTALSLSPIANGASRIFWGWLSDRTGRENAMFLAFLLQAACLVAVIKFGRLSGMWFTVTLVLTFFTWGEVFSLFPSTTGDYFGSRNATSNYSFLYTAKGVASIIGGGLATLLFERFGSWSAGFYGSAALAFASALLALALRWIPLPRSPRQAAATQ
jgi:OFA family oxalate/formate antiporter-like MFS transporter